MKFVLEWDDSFSVDNPEIDAQHERLFNIISLIPEEFKKDDARLILHKLISHAEEHFTSEEQLMKTTGFPGLEKHKKLHSELMDQLKAIDKEDFPDKQSLINFKQFIINWMNQHFLDEDMEYAIFIRGREAKGD